MGPLGSMIYILPLMLIFFMLWSTRSQAKKQKELESSLKPGDVVVTQSGLIGKIIDLGEVNAKLEIAPGVNVKVRKASIQGPAEGDAKPAEPKDKANEKKA
jgi:preprotein translocase subunit YajC